MDVQENGVILMTIDEWEQLRLRAPEIHSAIQLRNRKIFEIDLHTLNGWTGQ